MPAAFLSGFQLSLALITAIGAQNAFVLRQGIRREHVLAVTLFCGISDAILIAAGVAGIGALTTAAPWVLPVLRYGGAAFLFWYGVKAFHAAWRGGEVLRAAGGGGAPLPRVLGALALITWANPHVWLDTVVLIGSVSAQFPGARVAFAAGAALASMTFFLTLGFGARLIAPLFARPRAWQALDVGVGVIMWTIAASLLIE